jgi:hypothetical protein
VAHHQSNVWMFGQGPLVPVDGPHTLAVAAVYSLIFALIAFILIWKRDVKE